MSCLHYNESFFFAPELLRLLNLRRGFGLGTLFADLQSDPATQLSPMMAQYRRIKGELPPEALLLFRLGDFYEMFFEDAQSRARNCSTSR